MDYNKIIIILVIAVAALLIAGFVFFNPFKTDTNINIVSDSVLFDGDNFVVQLTDSKGTPLANETVNLIITDANGGQNPQKLKTDANGMAILQLKGMTPGKYIFNVQFDGNMQYKLFNTSQNIELKELTSVSSSTSQSDSSSALPYSIDNLPPSKDPNPETKRYQIDEYHVAQEYSDHYRSIVDLRTGERHGGYF